jgi:hypothetical protein
VQAHQYTQDTGTQRSTMRKQREVEGRTRGGKPQVFFSFPCQYFNQCKYKTSSILVYASSTTPGAYGYNPVLMLPLPNLAGNAVLVWYSVLSHNLWWRGSTSYHGTPKLGVINHSTWSSDNSFHPSKQVGGNLIHSFLFIHSLE